MTTLLQLRRMVRNRLGSPPSDSFFSDDKVDDAINNAIATLESERNWPWQERMTTLTTGDDTGSIPLPADWRSTRSVWAERELDFLPTYELERWYTTGGTPTVFSHLNGNLELRPKPATGTTVKLYYDRNPTLLFEDGDTPDLPSTAYPAIVAKAAQLCSTREDDRPSANTHLLEYSQWVDRLYNITVQSKRPAGRRIRPGGWI